MFTQDYSTPTFPATVDDEVCVTLRKAAQILHERGHAKGRLCMPDGSVCVQGAILTAMGVTLKSTFEDLEMVVWPHSMHKVHDTLTDHIGHLCSASWNNAPERTQAEVIAALEGAALTRARALAGRK